MKLEEYEVLIIGGGPVGITAARFLTSEKKIKVGVIRPEENSMIYCAEPYVIENLIPYEKTLKSDVKTTEFGAELIKDQVIKIEFEKKHIFLGSGKIIAYKILLIGIGASPLIPEIEGKNLENVFTLKTSSDLKNILKKKESSKKIVVVGAGAIGIELSQALSKLKKNVILVDYKRHILPNLLDSDIAKEIEKELSNITLIFGKGVNKIYGNKKVENIILSDGSEIDTDMVIFAVGSKPELKLFKNSKLEIGKTGIKVNSMMQTNIRDVYAAGDCVEYTSYITKKIVLGKLATNAVPMSKVACSNILGKERHYKGYINGAVTKIGKWFVGGTGLTENYCSVEKIDIIVGIGETSARFPIMPDCGKIKVKLIFNKCNKKIIGGQIYGTMAVAERIDLISLGIQNDFTIENFIEFSYCAQPYQTFFPAKNAIVEAAENALKKF